MRKPSALGQSRPASPKQPDRFWARALLALALAMPGLAYPASLTELLRMPLEQLLQLKISPLAGAVGSKL